MHKWLVIPTLLQVSLVFALAVSEVNAGVIAPNLPPGTPYQLLFVTSGVRDATSSNIADYNSFVTAQAALSPSLPSGVSWSAVASTTSIDARVNARNNFPVYTTDGLLVANALYQATISQRPFDQFGNGPSAAHAVWTGSTFGGKVDRGLGSVQPTTGDATDISSDGRFLQGTLISQTSLLPLYALSSPIGLTPKFTAPNLPPGSQYQLMFVTSGVRDATSSNIADYNAFVTAQAALNPLLPSGVTWHAAASTASVAALTNAPNTLPVYNVSGVLVTNSLYSVNILHAPTDQFGNKSTERAVWTGSDDNGHSDRPLGLSNPFTGDATDVSSSGHFLEDTTNSQTIPFPLYALSSPITVLAPEPATITMLGSALVMLGGIRLLRRVQVGKE